MKQWLVLVVVSVFAAFAVLSGCATTQGIIGEEFSKEIVPNSKTYFRQVKAVADEDGIRVSGKLYLKGNIAFNVPDFVEVALVDAGGKVISMQKVGYYPRMLTGKRKYRYARFTARFNQTPPSGSIIRLSNID